MDNDINTENDPLLTQFINITGADESIAKNTLEACNWNLEMAINMFVDSNFAQTSTSSSTVKKLPESSSLSTSGEVRPPIPPVRQVLVEDYPRHMYNNIVYDGFRNFQQESRWQEQQLSSESESSTENQRKTLDDLFRPPLDLIFKGTFEMAKFQGQHINKWLLVNVQNSQEFSCQVLNRDVWSNQTVKDIINEHFIFWQIYHNSAQGQNFISFYHVDTYPFISIIDPRTGEKVICWHELDTVTFCEKVTQFLNENPSPSGKVADSPNINLPKSHYDENEQLQIEAAIKASLQDIKDEKRIDIDETITKEMDSWKNYLGSDESNKMEIVIRYPDGNKQKVMFPSDSKIKALLMYVNDHGYNMKEYDLITNFPKKSLSSCDEYETLENVGIHSRDTLYVQIKN